MGRDVKGKKRALPVHETIGRSRSSSLSSPPEPEEPVPKRSKKAVTRTCPICNENIPVRLLEKHAELELRRVDDILRGNGPSFEGEAEAGPSRRGAATKARKSLHAMAPKSLTSLDSVEQMEKTIRIIKRNRKQRHGRLKEIIAQDDEENSGPVTLQNEATCPICSSVVRGDPDVIDAHVDACVINASRLQAEEEAREAARRAQEDVDAWGEFEVNGEVRLRLTNAAGLRGSGIHVRDRAQADVDDEIDVDGDDEAVFGGAQFTEQDVLEPNFVINAPDVQVNVEDDEDEDGGPIKSLRDLVAEGKVVTRKSMANDIDEIRAEMEEVMGLGDADRMDQEIISAQKSGNSTALVRALESKIKQLESMRISSSTSSLCRICLDPYNEPTVSTGCWHTCCRECWLRCLGTTKLCPICKRITAASDLRRIFM